MLNKIKKWAGLVALIAIILFSGFYIHGKGKSGLLGTISSTDITATRVTQLLVDNGVQITANGLNIVAGGITAGGTMTLGNILWTPNRVTSLNQATTTICAIQSPAATSTLLTAGISFTVSTTTTSIVTLAKATTAFATTTLLGSASLAANALGTITASSTPFGLDSVNTFGPSTWFVVGMAGNSGTFSPTGVCQAVFQSTI